MTDLESLSPLLARPAALLYAAGTALYHAAYDHGWRSVERLERPVLSVGNLEVGGTGKTPAVLALAQAARRAGLHPAVLTRGYGGSGASGLLREGAWVGGPGPDPGDEPLLLSRALPDMPVLVGARRAEGAREFLARGGRADLFLLDDGFQHRPLARDRDLVLLDARRPFGNGRLLPAGTLREPPPALCRADHLLLTGMRPGEPIAAAVLRAMDRFAPSAPRTRAWVRPRGLAALGGAEASPPSLHGLAVHGVAAIGRPERFRALLEEEGARVEGWSVFRDHHRFGLEEVRELEGAARGRGLALVTTGKDAVRLAAHADPSAPWWVLDITLEVEGGWDALFARLLGAVPARRAAP